MWHFACAGLGLFGGKFATLTVLLITITPGVLNGICYDTEEGRNFFEGPDEPRGVARYRTGLGACSGGAKDGESGRRSCSWPCSELRLPAVSIISPCINNESCHTLSDLRRKIFGPSLRRVGRGVSPQCTALLSYTDDHDRPMVS